MENIVEKINEQRIDTVAERIDALPPELRAWILGLIEGAAISLQERKAG